MRSPKLAPALALLATAFLASCATPTARKVSIVPTPRDIGMRHEPALSQVAAQHVKNEIERHGYAAITPESTAWPESVRLVDAPGDQTDLVIYVWVQQVDLPRYPESDDRPIAWGGIDLRDEEDHRLAYAADLLDDETGGPSTDLFVVGDPRDPKTVAAAEEFGARILRAPAHFAEKIEEVLGSESPADG